VSSDLFDAATPTTAFALPGPQVRGLLEAAVPELALGLWSLLDVQPLSTVPHGGQRLTSCVARWTDHGDGRTTTAHLIVKEDRKRVPRWADRVARQLVATGRGAGARHRVALPYGVCAPGALVSERVFGPSVRAAMVAAQDTDAAADVGERLAGWLLDLQRAPVSMRASDRRGLADALPQLVEVASTVADRPTAVRALRRLAWQLQDTATRSSEQAGVVSHGDLHPGNVFLSGEETVAIDWDTAALREPAYDVGYALTQLVVSPLRAGVPLPLGVAAACRFWETYAADGGAASPSRVAVQAARALVQSMHFELVTYGNGREDVLDLWPRAALAVLEHGPAGLAELPEVTRPYAGLLAGTAV
jgi:aminoglycoside phosphotransferase (APT) family kinase protein